MLVYGAIMASKLARFERELGELNELADRRPAPVQEEEPRPEEAAAR